MPNIRKYSMNDMFDNDIDFTASKVSVIVKNSNLSGWEKSYIDAEDNFKLEKTRSNRYSLKFHIGLPATQSKGRILLKNIRENNKTWDEEETDIEFKSTKTIWWKVHVVYNSQTKTTSIESTHFVGEKDFRFTMNCPASVDTEQCNSVIHQMNYWLKGTKGYSLHYVYNRFIARIYNAFCNVPNRGNKL